jgi:plastocyanin
MKTKILFVLAVFVSLTSAAYPASVTVTNNGTSFVPNDITVDPGDTIVFDIGSAHNVVEVSQSTWEANGNTSNGGFSLGFGGGQLILNTPGTYYYVCTPHAALEMKGTITVTGTSTNADTQVASSEKSMTVYPNPFEGQVFLHFNLAEPSSVEVDLFEITGQLVKRIYKNSLEAGNPTTERIDLTFLKPGQYLLRYKSDRENNMQKVVKVLQ